MRIILVLLVALCVHAVFAEPSSRAILVDGDGPWRDTRWTLAVSEFNRLLTDAGYSVETVSPVDLQSVVGNPDFLLAVPSLESLPFETFQAVKTHLSSGANLLATGGEPFRTPLYLAPDGRWLDAAAYQSAVGSPPPQGPFFPPSFETLSPATKQYTNRSSLRVPFPRGRGLTSTADEQGRYRAIGDLLSPAATLYYSRDPRSVIIWLPWPQLADPFRAELVAALHAARLPAHLLSAGPNQIVWLPGEHITGAANIFNQSQGPATLLWSISGPSGVIPQPSIVAPFASGEIRLPLDIGVLPNGDYTLTFRLMIGDQEIDRIDSPLRVLDPTLSRQPDQKIRIADGSFMVGGRHVFLHGVNYWPRYIPGIDQFRFNGRSWLSADQYDPDVIEADLTQIAALNFNLVNIQYGSLGSEFGGSTQLHEARALMDFLERCRAHGIWVRIALLRATILNEALAGELLPGLGSFLTAAHLPGNDRVFAYELLWEPFLGSHDQGGQGAFINGVLTYNTGRLVLDQDWRAWINDQYGSIANAEQAWGFAAPRDDKGQVTNPLDDQITSDGPWRVMVAAYRRFLEDYLGRNLGLIAREIRRTDPDTPITYRNWTTMTADHNFNTGYDIGTGAAHLDFFSPETYQVSAWPDDRKWGLVTAYSRYRTGGKPVQWAEFGQDVGPNEGTPASRAAQASVCDTFMRLVNEDGSSADSVWWWPGGSHPTDGSDFGIIDPDGSPRDCALTLAQSGAKFAASPPDLRTDSPVTLSIDRDADARGSYGLFLNLQNTYLQARQAGNRVVLVDAGTGTDTATMPLIQVGNAPYAGTGPLKYANAEIGGVRIVCSTLDVTVENGSQVAIPAGAACQLTATLVNTGEAQWLPASASKGGVLLHTNLGDVPLTSSVPALQRIALPPLAITMPQSAINLTGRLRIQGAGEFGETLKLLLAIDSFTSGPCSISLSSAAPIAAPPEGAAGVIDIATSAGCAWQASSPQPWISVTPASGNGPGTAKYTILPNTGPQRQTTITIARRPLSVTQTPKPNPPLQRAPGLSATSLNFGGQSIGSKSGVQTVTLTNTGATALNLGVTIGGVNTADFAQTNTCGSSIAASATCTVNIAFTPSAAGARSAKLFISGNISGGPLAIALSGIGAATGPVPEIQAIVDSWGFTAGIAPGLWVTIAGANLAGPPETWDLTNLQLLPVTLGGVTVTFNNAPAALYYVSATQINALVPASVAPGPAQVIVEANGVASAPFVINAKATQPAVYSPPSADGSTFFVTAALAGTATLIGNRDTDPRVARPAQPGDVLDLYTIGLGATMDPSKFVTGKVFAGAFPVSAPVTATVGGKPAPVQFAGLTSPGLYLVRMTVPLDLAPGPQPLEITAGVEQTRSSLVLMVDPAPGH